MMNRVLAERVRLAKAAALRVLHHNAHGPFGGFPRTAGWGYPEPYTRDLMISSLGILASGDAELIGILRRVLESLGEHRTRHGHIPSLVHAAEDVGASDTTPLFLMALGVYREYTGEHDFLEEAAQLSLNWMEYQSPGDDELVGQLPTSDWRDEQWVLGFGIFVNAVVHLYLRLFNQEERAARLKEVANRVTSHHDVACDCDVQGLAITDQPYYALWSYKVYFSSRFDLLGNSLAIISGLASDARARAILQWVEATCDAMRARGELAVSLPPNFFPYILPGDRDWLARYEQYNRPGEYHNGGIWPFICGFYIVAALAAGQQELAEHRLAALTDLVGIAHNPELDVGFNEWFRAQDGTPQGQDWQTWSAAMYLYAAICVEQGSTLFFDRLRKS